jgi:hypothetical protein
MILKFKPFAPWAAVVLSLAGAAIVRADTIVNFSVDMSVQIGNASFIPGTDQVEAHGTFNGWGALVLVRDGITSIYTNTANNSTDPNGGVMQYKYVINGSNWENPADAGKNRAAKLPSTSGATLTLPTPYFSDAGTPVANDVTFRVNMAQQINLGNFTPGASTVYARGDFNGFDLSLVLTNDPLILTTNQFGLVTSNVYVGTATVTASPNAAETFKYYYDPGANWENPSPNNGNPDHDNNRFFVNAAQTLPLVDYSDSPYAPIATNEVTFQVDMSAQALTGAFANGMPIDVRGNFNNWTGGANPLTNNPAASNTNIYSTVIVVTDGVGAVQQYKFTYTGGSGLNWENPAPPTVGGNRFFNQPNATSTVLPPVFFSDQPLNDLLLNDTPVTFTIDMNGAVGNDAHVFEPSSDTLYINGQFANWYAWWGGANPVPAPPQYQMTEYPIGSGIYSNTVIVPKGTPVVFEYKYGIGVGGAPGPNDNEAGFGQNHRRTVRTTGAGSYTMPQDKFGNQYVEPAWGNLAIGAKSGGTVPVTWLGRPGLHLQFATGLNAAWQDLFATDGTNWTSGSGSTNGFVSQTNWPAAGNTYFRLVKPAN